MFALQLRYYLWLRRNKVNTWRWLKLGFALEGAMWACLFGILLFVRTSDLVSLMQQAFLPALTITLGLQISHSIISFKRIH